MASTMSRATTSLVTTPLKALASPLSTPSQSTTPQAEIPPSPGTFRHPRLTEIIKRQSASTLSGQKIQNIVINTIAIALTFVFHNAIEAIFGTCLSNASIPPSTLRAQTLINLLRLLFLTNVVLCLRPVLPYMSPKDDISDIPLTPSQRALLGLPSSAQNSPAPAASTAGYVTPPRYRRDGGVNTSTSAQSSPLASSTGRRSTSANYSSSPLSTSRHTLGFSPSPQPFQTQSARTYRPGSDSPFAGSPGGSPLLHRAVTNDFNQSTFTTVGGRASFGTSTSSLGFGMSRSQSMRGKQSGLDDADSLPGTPSPSGSKRQPGVNYKWLYDKGARLPRSESTGF